VKRVALGTLALIVLGAGALGGYVLYKKHESRNIRGSTVEFVATEEPEASAGRRRPNIPWATYGFDAARTHVAAGRFKPPFRRLWTFRARNLVEFPPSIGYGRLYFANNTGVFFSVSTQTGKRAWKYVSKRCVAASPALDRHTVFMTFLNKPPCNSTRSDIDGEVIAFAAGGRIRWKRTIGPSESSPLVANHLVYVGDWRGRVYALRQANGRIAWSFQTGDKVKDAVALSGDRVFFGSYDSHVYALDAKTGKLIWRAAAQERLGPRGRFYSTPAVAYGRVYIGATDGKVYSFGAATGKLRWSRSSGGYVYASPAVWHRLVLVGSYGGDFYALDAATGDVRWTFHANGPISGSATVLNGVVYFATLNRRTYALDARTGRQLWTYPDGKYSPLVADRHRVYLVGYFRVYGARPRYLRPR
jgi:outer membrane protein assembly factor BamB